MIDLHGHYLPWVDDGAQSLEDGLRMLRQAHDDGIRVVVLTPKVEPGRWNNTRASLAKKFDLFRQVAANRGIGVDLRLGAEAMHGPETLNWIERGDVPSLGEWDGLPVILLRWREDFIPIGAISATQRLLERGMLPMLAHPERNPGVMRSPGALDFFLRDGCLIQIDAGSVLGWYGVRARDTAFRLIEAGWATVMSSGAHDSAARRPMLGLAREMIVERFGGDVARRLTDLNPSRITAADPSADVPILNETVEASGLAEAAEEPMSTRASDEESASPLIQRHQFVGRRPRLRIMRWARQPASVEASAPSLRL